MTIDDFLKYQEKISLQFRKELNDALIRSNKVIEARLLREAEHREKALKREAEEREKALKREAEQREEALKRESEQREKSSREFEKRLIREAEQREKALKRETEQREKALKRETEQREKALKREAEERLKSKKEFDKRLGEITGTLGRFVESMVRPGILELFCERGFIVKRLYPNHVFYDTNEQAFAEVDLLLVNKTYAIAVEAKTTLTVANVDDHLERLQKIQQNPDELITGKTLYGAIVGMSILEEADRYAYRKGLFVLKQKGEIITIANDDKFVPKEWKTR